MFRNKNNKEGRRNKNLPKVAGLKPPYEITNVPKVEHTKHFAPNDDLYQRCVIHVNNPKQIVSIYSNYVFDPIQFKHFFYDFKYREYANARKALRKIIQMGTVIALLRNKYAYMPYNQVQVQSAAADEEDQELAAATATKQPSPQEEILTKEFIRKEYVRSQSTTAEKGVFIFGEEGEDGTVGGAGNDDDDDEEAKLLNAKPFGKAVDGVETVLINKSIITQSIENTYLIKSDDIDQVPAEGVLLAEAATIQVIHGDCLDVAMLLKEQTRSKDTLKPALFIAVNQFTPAANYRGGAASTEEAICRRSNLFMCLEDPYAFDKKRKWEYPIDEFGCVYVKKCIVFRDGEESGYAFYDKPKTISIIGASPYPSPPVEKLTKQEVEARKAESESKKEEEEAEEEEEEEEEDNEVFGDELDEDEEDEEAADGGKGETSKPEEEGVEWRFSGKIIKRVRQKLIAMFEVARAKGHDTVVISAFGAGHYANPPKHVAELFKEVITAHKYNLKFKHIIFAITDTDVISDKTNNPKGNVQPFGEVLVDGKVMSYKEAEEYWQPIKPSALEQKEQELAEEAQREEATDAAEPEESAASTTKASKKQAKKKSKKEKAAKQLEEASAPAAEEDEEEPAAPSKGKKKEKKSKAAPSKPHKPAPAGSDEEETVANIKPKKKKR